jgi:phosphomannomutase
MSESSQSITFGTDGWRGVIAKDFTFANVGKVTRAIAQYLDVTYPRSRPVLIGYDTRFLAQEFAETAGVILAELGWTVQICDRDCPTPVIAYSARHLNTAGALMFTASHNPAHYCGIKYIPDYAGPATQAITDRIVHFLSGASPGAETSGPPQGHSVQKLKIFDPKPAYLAFLYTQLNVERIRAAGLCVKYDALYSTSRGYLDEALQHCGCTTESFHAYRDVLFGGGMPEPKGAQLADLAQAVLRDGADVGLATDGDSDRFGILDEQGALVPPNAILLLLAQHLIENKGRSGAIVRTVATTHLLDTLAAQYGLPLHETAVGFKWIGEKMRQVPVLIGGEESGGVSVLGHIPEKDGILANMLVVEAIAYSGKPLSQLVREVIAKTHGPLYNHRIDLFLTPAAQAHLMQHFAAHPPRQVAHIPIREIGCKDGIKLYLEDGSWVLLRPSGTEPLLRVYLETHALPNVALIMASMQQMIAQISAQISSVAPDSPLPCP